MTPRRKSKPIRIGNVTIGGDAPVRVQSMTCTDTRDVSATVRQIKELEEYGCELVRLAVPDAEAARALKEIKRQVNVPLIADIHFGDSHFLEVILIHEMVHISGIILILEFSFFHESRLYFCIAAKG